MRFIVASSVFSLTCSKDCTTTGMLSFDITIVGSTSSTLFFVSRISLKSSPISPFISIPRSTASPLIIFCERFLSSSRESASINIPLFAGASVSSGCFFCGSDIGSLADSSELFKTGSGDSGVSNDSASRRISSISSV